MARKTKKVVIAELIALDVEFDPDDKYDDLWNLLKEKTKYDDKIPAIGSVDDTGPVTTLGPLKIVNRLKKLNTFLSDAVRNERDTEFLNREIGKREYKGKLLRVTTVKEYVVSADGYWETSFTIDLKE